MHQHVLVQFTQIQNIGLRVCENSSAWYRYDNITVFLPNSKLDNKYVLRICDKWILLLDSDRNPAFQLWFQDQHNGEDLHCACSAIQYSKSTQHFLPLNGSPICQILYFSSVSFVHFSEIIPHSPGPLSLCNIMSWNIIEPGQEYHSLIQFLK